MRFGVGVILILSIAGYAAMPTAYQRTHKHTSGSRDVYYTLQNDLHKNLSSATLQTQLRDFKRRLVVNDVYFSSPGEIRQLQVPGKNLEIRIGDLRLLNRVITKLDALQEASDVKFQLAEGLSYQSLYESFRGVSAPELNIFFYDVSDTDRHLGYKCKNLFCSDLGDEIDNGFAFDATIGRHMVENGHLADTDGRIYVHTDGEIIPCDPDCQQFEAFYRDLSVSMKKTFFFYPDRDEDFARGVTVSSEGGQVSACYIWDKYSETAKDRLVVDCIVRAMGLTNISTQKLCGRSLLQATDDCFDILLNSVASYYQKATIIE